MPKLTFAGRDGAQMVDYTPGDTLMTIAVRNMVVGIEAQCGGSAACGTCIVEIPEKWQVMFPEMASDEQDMLDAVAEGRSNLRLSCQLVLTAEHDGLHVTIPESMMEW